MTVNANIYIYIEKRMDKVNQWKTLLNWIEWKAGDVAAATAAKTKISRMKTQNQRNENTSVHGTQTAAATYRHECFHRKPDYTAPWNTTIYIGNDNMNFPQITVFFCFLCLSSVNRILCGRLCNMCVVCWISASSVGEAHQHFSKNDSNCMAMNCALIILMSVELMN